MTTTTENTLTYQIDPAHSRAHFAIRHLMIAHVRGEFTQVTGTVTYNPSDLTELQVDATIDATTFHSGNAQRDEHIKGSHFLDVEQFSTLTFVSKQATAGEHGTVQVTGDLTLHGVTHEVALNVLDISQEITDPWGNRRLGVTVTSRINRHDFGITFNAPTETGGLVLGNDVDITLDLELTRKPE